MTHPNPFRMTRDTQIMSTSNSLKAISAAMQKDAELYAMALREDGLFARHPLWQPAPDGARSKLCNPAIWC